MQSKRKAKPLISCVKRGKNRMSHTTLNVIMWIKGITLTDWLENVERGYEQITELVEGDTNLSLENVRRALWYLRCTELIVLSITSTGCLC